MTDADFAPFLEALGVPVFRAKANQNVTVPPIADVAGYDWFMSHFAGATFAEGLYRVHVASSQSIAAEWVAIAFPQFADRVQLFGYDWLGTQFGVDVATAGDRGEPQVLIFEAGSGAVLEVPTSFLEFHTVEIARNSEAAVAASLFAEWRAANPRSSSLGLDECIGYRVPLFLGGADEVANLELSDIDVYWTLISQLIRSAS